MPPLHLIIPTHTTRHLRATLAAAASQTRPPDSITVTSDADDPSIEALLRDAAPPLDLPLTLVRRAHTGRERLAQVRNNALRALLARHPGLSRDARLLFLDGDCPPAHDALAQHHRLGDRGELVIASRINLTQEQTERFDLGALAQGQMPVDPSPEQWAALRTRDRRSRRQLFLRRFGLAKRHKPKPLGGHHSITLGAYLDVNGYDEEYHTWGTEDDDFGRRVYAAGARPVLGVLDILVFHLWHATRNPGDWHARDNARRFASRTPTRAVHGFENPIPQPPVDVIELAPGR